MFVDVSFGRDSGILLKKEMVTESTVTISLPAWPTLTNFFAFLKILGP